jgi:hypothetical protein
MRRYDRLYIEKQNAMRNIVAKELEEQTAALWLAQGTVKIDCLGSENTYYVDQFDNRFFCKNYPRPNEF